MRLILKIATFTCLALATILPTQSFAQANSDGPQEVPGATARYEAGFHLGNLLPNQISGMREITGMGGARFGYRMGETTFAETGLTAGNGSGAQWKNYTIAIRTDHPIEGVIALAYVGGDIVYYKGVGQSEKIIFGGHAGGGLKMHLGGMTWFRTDMKFGISPGTSLYISAGFEFRFGEADQGS